VTAPSRCPYLQGRKQPSLLATSPQLRSFPAPAERDQARPGQDLPRSEPELTLATPPPSLVATLRESKELVFLLVGIALAFTLHFGFRDFVSTESSTPTSRPVANRELGNSERVRAAAYERAGQRAARERRAARRVRAAQRASAARAASASAASRSSARATFSTQRATSNASPTSARSAPVRPAPSKPRPAPAKTGGGGGQSFDDSG
jgi:hypothetical protein